VLARVRRLVRPVWRPIAERNLGGHRGELHVNYPCRFTRTTFLGHNVHFNGMRISGTGRVDIGDNFHSGAGCLIITDVHNYEGTELPYDDTVIVKDVVIEDNVWLGDRVIVLGGVRIGEGAIIQAGSVVVRDIEPCVIAGGHPAVPFSARDRAHYDELKQRDARR